MPQMPEELQRLLDEYLNALPWYRRWPLKAALKVFSGLDDVGCLGVIIVLLVIGVVFYLIGRALGYW
jgi:hypothetical protein